MKIVEKMKLYQLLPVGIGFAFILLLTPQNLFAQQFETIDPDETTTSDTTTTPDESIMDEEETEPDTTGLNIDFNWGFRAGVSSSAFSQDYRSFTKQSYGVVAGAFICFNFTNFLGLSVEPMYAQEGANQLNPAYIYYSSSITLNQEEKVNSNVTLHNLEVPVLLNFTIPVELAIKPRFLIGGSFDYIYKAYTRDLIHDLSYDVVLSNRGLEDITSSLEYFNYCVIAGAGLDFETETLNYSLSVRYKVGLQPVSNLATLNVDNTGKDDFSYNSLHILFGVSF